MMTFGEVLSKLRALHANVRSSPNGYTANCPACGDHENKLSVSEGDGGKLLLHCYRNCSFDQVLQALGGGASQNGHREPGDEKTEAPKFTYSAGIAQKLAEALIDQWKDGGAVAKFLESRGISKDVSLALELGATDRTFTNVGVSDALAIPVYRDQQLVGMKYRAVPEKDFVSETGSDYSRLYGRPDLAADEILLLEGPLDVALAMSHGFNAVGIQSAANKNPSAADLRLLRRFPTAFLVGDNDPKGIHTMNAWQAALVSETPGVGVCVRLGEHKDIGELYAAGPKNFRANLGAILRLARGGREYFEWHDLLDEDEILLAQPAEREVVDKLIPACAITMFFGEEKSGKSVLSRYIAKCIANGVPVFGKYACREMKVLILELENNGRTCRACAICSNVSGRQR